MEQIQNNRVITDLYRENAQFPGIALDGSDVYLCWQRFVDRHDSLMASCRRGDEVVWEREISDGGEVLHPVILAHGGAIWYAWSEYARENWRLLARCYRDGQWGEVLTVASGEALFFPRLFTWQGRLHVIWTEQHKGSAAAVLCPLTEAGPGAAETVSAVGEAYRAGAAEGGDGNYNISIVFKTTSNEYTQYMMAGAEKAAAETGAVLDMKGATSETAYDEQQNMIETDLHANKYDAMIIAPLQGDMASTLVSGTDMPIFAIDTDFNAPEKISFIGIGQKDAAASGGEKAVEAAKAAGWDKIEAAYIAGVQGDSTADARRTGFQEGIDGAGGTFLADEVQYADAVADKATVCMEGIMQSHPEGLAIIACHNDDCAIAAARAAANNPAYAKTIFIGFDGNITAAQSILDGGETMTVAQSGYDQGYQAVKTVVAHLNGEKVDSFVDCGTKVIDSTTAEDYMATLKSQMDGKAVAQ